MNAGTWSLKVGFILNGTAVKVLLATTHTNAQKITHGGLNINR